MKKLIVATMMLYASTAQAADWSPVFKEWVSDCWGFSHPVAKSAFEASSDYVPEYFKSTNSHTILSQEGRLGHYLSVPMPYRQDLMPAVQDYDFGTAGGWSAIYIPMSNAKFYGLPLHGIAYYDNDIYWFSGLNFGKYSKAKERQLKKIITPLQKNSEYFKPQIEKAVGGELVLYCYEELL